MEKTISTTMSPVKLRQLKKIVENIIVNNNLPINRIITEIDTNFDFHRAAGKTYGISLTKREKGSIIINSFSDQKIMKLVGLLVDIYRNDGMYLGKHYKLIGISSLLNNLRTPPKKPQNIKVFLKIDISKSSLLTRKYPDKIRDTIRDIKKACEDVCMKRKGVLIKWQGDGGFFLFNESTDSKKKCNQATLSAIQIIHWIYEYNIFQNKLDEPIAVKVVVDVPVNSLNNAKYTQSTDIYSRINNLESEYSEPNTALFSDFIYMQLTDKIKPYLKSFYIGSFRFRQNYYLYSVNLAKLKN